MTGRRNDRSIRLPDRAERILDEVCREYGKILGDNLTGFYVHGSLCFGCFRWEKSDLDFIVAVKRPLTLEEKNGLISVLMDRRAQAPPKGFEMSVVLEGDCRGFTYPTPFELHFSNSHLKNIQENLEKYCREMHGTDPDLAAHFTVVREKGITWYGKSVEEMFAPVPEEAYLDSIWQDIAEAEEDVRGNPVYVILNLCRVLAYRREKKVLSKEQGGRWALHRLWELPENYREMVGCALMEYTGAEEEDLEKEKNSGWALPLEEMDGLEEFCLWMKEEIRK